MLLRVQPWLVLKKHVCAQGNFNIVPCSFNFNWWCLLNLCLMTLEKMFCYSVVTRYFLFPALSNIRKKAKKVKDFVNCSCVNQRKYIIDNIFAYEYWLKLEKLDIGLFLKIQRIQTFRLSSIIKDEWHPPNLKGIFCYLMGWKAFLTLGS